MAKIRPFFHPVFWARCILTTSEASFLKSIWLRFEFMHPVEGHFRNTQKTLHLMILHPKS